MKAWFKRLPMWAKVAIGILLIPVGLIMATPFLVGLIFILFSAIIADQFFGDSSLIDWLDERL